MLLRSSSSPVLESLLGPLVSCHTEPFADIKQHHDGQAGAEAVLPASLSLSSRGSTSSPLTTCLTNFDPQGQSGHGGCPSFHHGRKVLSEPDLCSLAAGSSSTPAQFAANSLLHDDSTKGCLGSDLDLVMPRSTHPHVKKGKTLQPISRWRSLGSLPSELPSLFFDSDSAILEEGESASPSLNSSAAGEEEEEVCAFDKLAFPVGNALNVKVEQVIDAANEDLDLHVVDDHSSLSRSTADKIDMQGLGGEERGSRMNFPIPSAVASFSGRQEPRYVLGDDGTSPLFKGKERGSGTAVLVPLVHGQASPPKYVHLGDAYEVSLGAGDGGGGARPPTSTGGKGGGGEGGGRGGRNSDPTELHYQSMLENNPGHPLILQNYAQYLVEVKCDYRKAEEYFQRAILANPTDGELLGQYAKMLWEVQQDRERAATYFERAVQAAPDNSYVMAAYASFLWSAEEEEEEEQESVEDMKGASPVIVPASVVSLVSAGLV